MTLNALETFFQNYLLHESKEILSEIKSDSRLTVEKRLAIYYSGYRSRLFEILENDYPKLQILLGTQAFTALCEQFLHQCPSHYFTVRYVGQRLSQFLQETLPYRHHPYLAEMALFEWAMGNTLDAADAQILSTNVLQTLPLEDFAKLRIQLHPATQLLYFNWDIPELWQAINQNEPERQPCQNTKQRPWVIFRSEMSCQFRSLEPAEALALQKVQNSETMEEICEALCAELPEQDIPVFIVSCLNQWLNEGLIIG